LKYNEIHDKATGLSYYTARHDSGAEILIYKDSGFKGGYAVFGTRYGSIDTDFRRDGQSDYLSVPPGIAHFLEHKLFESEDGGVFQKYAETGASANAYTSFDRTCYLFQCSDNFKKNFDILLDFVQKPYFTEENVEKEQGIIAQEIRMYDDSASWQVFFNLLRGMYQTHPVRIDIAGTVDSIAKIDDKILYECYNTFYNPGNMFIAVAGNVDVEETLAQIELSLNNGELKIENGELDRLAIDEPQEVGKSYIETKLPVAMPLMCFGIKLDVKGVMPLKSRVCGEMLLAVLAGKSSELQEGLFGKQLINDSFEAELFYGRDYACLIFSCESCDPAAAQREIKSAIVSVKQSGIDAADFQRIKRKRYGRLIMQYNDAEHIASRLVNCAMFGEELFGEQEILRGLTTDDVNEFLRGVDPGNSILSVVLPA